MIGYKVVQSFANPLGGAYLASTCAPWTGAVVYETGQATHRKPSCGPLCVFTEAASARAAAHVTWQLVFRCEFVPSEDREVWCPGGRRFDARKDYPGTAYAESVTLLAEEDI